MGQTKLHQLIEQSRWESVLEHLRTKQSDAKERHHRSGDVLPLHMACDRKAPDSVILALLEAHPEAAREKGRGGNLPLHIATHRNLSVTVIEALIRHYPEALDGTNHTSYTPRNIGHSDLIAFQALRRPTCCWHQIMEHEGREEDQDVRLKSLAAKVHGALASIQETERTMDELMERLEKAEKQVKDIESVQTELSMKGVVASFRESITNRVDNLVSNRLTTIEDEIQASSAKEFMAKAASKAHQEDVVRIQRKTSDSVKKLHRDIIAYKRSLDAAAAMAAAAAATAASNVATINSNSNNGNNHNSDHD